MIIFRTICKDFWCKLHAPGCSHPGEKCVAPGVAPALPAHAAVNLPRAGDICDTPWGDSSTQGWKGMGWAGPTPAGHGGSSEQLRASPWCVRFHRSGHRSGLGRVWTQSGRAKPCQLHHRVNLSFGEPKTPLCWAGCAQGVPPAPSPSREAETGVGLDRLRAGGNGLV